MILVLVGVAVIAARASEVRVRWTRETSSQAIWSAEQELLVFVGIQDNAWSGSSLECGWRLALQRLYVATPIEVAGEKVLVFRWTGDGFVEQTLEDTPISTYLVADGHVVG